MIEAIDDLPDGVVGLEAVGEVHSTDYETVAKPAIERALGAGGKVNLLYVLGDRFTGYSGGAMWEDAKLGLSHPFDWGRIAVVTDDDHLRRMMQSVGWLIPGEVKLYPTEELDRATAWVSA